MRIGYARVSTKDQDLSLQTDALEKAGCEKIYREKESGKSTKRPRLKQMLSQLRKGDVVVVWKLDRLARSLKDLIDLVNKMHQGGVELKSLHDQIDTSTPQGKFTFHLFAAMAEFERDLISERTRAGLESARAQGRVGGRPKGLSQKAQHKAMLAERLYLENELSTTDICEQLSISRGTFYNYLRHQGVAVGHRPKKLKVEVWLRVERNNKYVRGQGEARDEIERHVFSQYKMKKLQPNGWDYELTIPYHSDEELEKTVHEILAEASRTADLRNCFIEADVRALDGSERYW